MEGEFRELRRQGVLRSSPRKLQYIVHLGDMPKPITC
jgi:hypothetical protein